MKIQSLLVLCLALFVFNCSKSDDSDGDKSRPDGEIMLLFNTAISENTIQFTSTHNLFEIPCDFGEIDMFTPVNVGNDSFESLDINIPYTAIIAGNNFMMSDTFPDGLGNELTSAVSLRVNGTNYRAISGGFSNMAYTLNEDGQAIFSCIAILTMEAVGIPGRGTGGDNIINVRIEIIGVGKGDTIVC